MSPLEDKAGEYETPLLCKKSLPTHDGVVASLLPEGIGFLTGDYLIEIKETLGS
jgi:hypothetical protein